MHKLKNIIKQWFINNTFRLFYGKSYNTLENWFLISMLWSGWSALVGLLCHNKPVRFWWFDLPVALHEHGDMLLRSVYVIRPPDGKKIWWFFCAWVNTHWSLQAWQYNYHEHKYILFCFIIVTLFVVVIQCFLLFGNSMLKFYNTAFSTFSIFCVWECVRKD